MRCCAEAWRCHSRGPARGRYVYAGRYAAYRNSQFARAFTFEFPLLTFRIVVLHSTPGAPLREMARVIDAVFPLFHVASIVREMEISRSETE